MPVYISYLKV